MSVLPKRSTGSVSSNDGGILRKGTRIPGPTAPNGEVVGDIWYDTSVYILKVWNGVAWDYLDGGGGGGPPPAAEHYLFTQLTPSATWVINHNLGWEPNISVFDSAGNEVIGDVYHNSVNQLTVSFIGAFAGRATAS